MVPGSPDAPFHLTQPAGLALPSRRHRMSPSLRSLDVADNAAVVIIKELHADLRDVTGVSRPAEDTVDLCQHLCSTGVKSSSFSSSYQTARGQISFLFCCCCCLP